MEKFKMNEVLISEWLERNCKKAGNPIGLRTYKTDIKTSGMEDFIIAITEHMEGRNANKTKSLNQNILGSEKLETVSKDDDGYWRYTVSMVYIPIKSYICKKHKNQPKKEKKRPNLIDMANSRKPKS